MLIWDKNRLNGWFFVWKLVDLVYTLITTLDEEEKLSKSWKKYPYGDVPEGRKKKWYAAYIHAGYASLEEGVRTPKKPKQSWKEMVAEEADRINS